MRRFRQGEAPVILYSRSGVKLYDFGLNRIIGTDDEDLINLLLAMGAVEIPPAVSPVPQDLSEVAARINALDGRVVVVEGRADIRSVGDGLSLSGAGELSATGSGSGGVSGSVDWANVANKPADLVRDAAYQHTDNNYTTTEKDKLAGLENYDDTALSARVSANETALDGHTVGANVPSDAVFTDTVYDDTALAARVTANETGLAARYTKAETDGKIAEAMTDVDNEHFHPVTALPDPADADPTKRPKENHEYVLIEYEQDGTTIKSETHYLFYGGVYHQKKTTVSLDGYATEQYVNDGLDQKASLNIATIAGGGGGDEISATVSQGTDSVNVNYYKDSELPNALNLNVGADGFRIPTTGYVDIAVSGKQDSLVSGTNIKKIGNIDLLGSGAVDVATVNNESLIDGGNINTAKILYDVTDQSTVLSDNESDVQIGIIKVDENTLNINETAPDNRGQSQAVYNMNIPTKDYVDGALASKQDTLVSGTNIKTVNGNDLLGAGNVEIAGGVNFAVNAEKWYGTYTDENGVTYQVYSKMIYIPALPSTAGVTTYSHGISGIKQILQVYGFTTDGFVLNAPRQSAQDNISIYQMSKSASNQTLSIEVGKDRSNKAAYVCLVYAKNN